MLTSELLERAKEAYAADPSWLGSEAHRNLLQEFFASRAPGVTSVRWLEPGGRSHKDERGVIHIERPVERNDERDVVRLHSEIALHELLHALYSDYMDAAAMNRTLGLLRGWFRATAEQLFQWLEDARVRRCEHKVEPGNDEYVKDLHRWAMEQVEEEYRERAAEDPWIETPEHTYAQVRVALAERILVGARGSRVAPLVAQIVDEVQPFIDQATSARDTRGARTGALEITDVILAHRNELN